MPEPPSHAPSRDRQAPRELRAARLRSLIRSDAPHAESGTSLSAGIAAMQQRGGDSLLVLSRGRLVGVLTERDILLKVLGRGYDPDAVVDTLMTPRPETLTGDATLVDALELMDRTGARTIVLEGPDGSLEGVIRQRDILAFVAEAFPEEILNLPPRPHQVAGTPEGG